MMTKRSAAASPRIEASWNLLRAVLFCNNPLPLSVQPFPLLLPSSPYKSLSLYCFITQSGIAGEPTDACSEVTGYNDCLLLATISDYCSLNLLPFILLPTPSGININVNSCMYELPQTMDLRQISSWRNEARVFGLENDRLAAKNIPRFFLNLGWK